MSDGVGSRGAGPPRGPVKITVDMLDVRPATAPAAAPAAARPLRAATTHASPARGGRADFERGMSYAPPLTLAIMLANVAVFVWQASSGALESREAIVAAGALVRSNVLAGEYWRLLSAAFLHGGVDHLVGNMTSLYILGMACEHAFERRSYAAAYLLSALGCSLLSLANGPGPAVGASGAIFGLMGAIVVFLHRERDRFFVRDKRIGVVIGFWALYTFAMGALSPVVDNAGHLGGFIAGALIAFRLPARARPAGAR